MDSQPYGDDRRRPQCALDESSCQRRHLQAAFGFC